MSSKENKRLLSDIASKKVKYVGSKSDNTVGEDAAYGFYVGEKSKDELRAQ